MITRLMKICLKRREIPLLNSKVNISGKFYAFAVSFIQLNKGYNGTLDGRAKYVR
jgi:hypothetical protein